MNDLLNCLWENGEEKEKEINRLQVENNELKADKETLQAYVNVFGACAKEIGRARLEEICEAVKYIGQTGYAVCTDLEDNLIVAPVEINKIEISDNNIWIKGTGSCEFYTLAVIGYLIFFGENAKQLAESKYNELTAQSGKGE